MGIVKKFEEKLLISRREAWARVFIFFALALALLAFVGYCLASFPYDAAYIKEFPLIPGNHTPAFKIEGSETALVSENGILNITIQNSELLASEANFLNLVNESFVVLEKGKIIYLGTGAGVTFRYEQSVSSPTYYYPFPLQSTDSTARFNMERSNAGVLLGIFLFIFVCIIILLLMLITQHKEEDEGLTKINYGVWRQ